MTPLRGLFLVTLLASAPAVAEPLDKLQVDAGPGKIQFAEQRVVCPPRGNRECRTVDVKPIARAVEGSVPAAGDVAMHSRWFATRVDPIKQNPALRVRSEGPKNGRSAKIPLLLTLLTSANGIYRR